MDPIYYLLSYSNLFVVMFLGALLVYLGFVVLWHVWLVHMLVLSQVTDELCGLNYRRKLMGPPT
jgi:hypothetical protein